MSELDIFDPIVDWARKFPESIALFEKYGIDYCCGGKSLEYACRRRGCDPHQIVKEIQQAAAARPKS